MTCRATGFFIKYSKQNFNFRNRGSPVEISSSTCILKIHFSGSSPSPANIYCFIIHIKLISSASPWKIPSTLNKNLNRKSLMGVSTKEAVSIDRLNYTESVKLQLFTLGLKLSKSQQETNSADSQGCVCSCPHQWGRNNCYTGFQVSRDFPLVAKPINWHVSQNTLPCQPPTLPIVKTNSDWTSQQVMALQSFFHDYNGHCCQCGGTSETLIGLGLAALN